MPELPEVETVVNYLRPQIINQSINKIQIFCTKIFNLDQALILDLIIGKTILAVFRRGKYIIIKLSAGYLVVHLRMTGKLFATTKTNLDYKQKHLHVIIELDNYMLLFVDQRQFGKINFCENLDWLEEKLGPEPLLENFTVNYLTKILKSKQKIKALLLDQSKIAGLGNIYVDEILWQAAVHPQVMAININTKQINLIYLATREILSKAISMQGTTFLSYAFNGNQKGNYLSYLKVFNRAKQNCLRCGNIIIKIRVAQRGTHVCEICQQIK